jgi:hypothetical protein
LAGVVLLVLFFVVVSWLHHKTRMPIVVADVGGVVAYVGLAAGVATFPPLPFAPTLAVVLGVWAAANLGIWGWARRRHEEWPRATVAGGSENGLGPVRRLLVVFVGSAAAVAFGGLLSGLIVTFPYSGVLVAIESRRSLPTFTRLFALNSLGLVAFMSAYYAFSEHGSGVALAVAWVAFSVTVLLLHLRRVLRASSTLVAKLLD